MVDRDSKNKNSDEFQNEKRNQGPLLDEFPKEIYDDEDQIRFSDILNIIWEGRRKILFITLFLFVFSIFHYATAPEEYFTDSTFLPERQVQQFQLDRFFAFGDGGRNLNVGGSQADGSLPSYFYVDIIASVDFQRELLNREIYFINSNEYTTLMDYFNDVYEQPFRARVYSTIRRYTIGLPMRIFSGIGNLFRPRSTPGQMVRSEADSPEVVEDANLRHVYYRDGYYVLTPEFLNASSQMVERIQLDYGTLTIQVMALMPDPMAAVQVTNIVAEMVQEYLIEYRIEKARQNLEYIEVLYEEAEERYEQAQRELALFIDRNQGILTALAETEKSRFEDRRNLAFSLYSSVSNRLEEARTKVKEDTPVYTTFQAPVFPEQPMGGNPLVLPASILLGIFFGVLWILIEKVFTSFIKLFRTGFIHQS